jgi:glycosyltransferase involved in cell wall biosynthesis
VISFVVPAHDEERLLGRTLDAIRTAAGAVGQPSELIVVDDASTDATAAIARGHGARVIRVTHRQIAATRNAGAREARGDVLVFVDADTVVTAEAVRGAVEAIRSGAVGGGARIRFDGRVPLYGRVLLAVLVPIYRLVGIASGCFLFCTAAAFRAAGGFDESLFAGEEVVMSRALRRRGRLVVLRETVTTSGRKVRAYSAQEVAGIVARMAIAGRDVVKRRERMEPWYGPRRADPGCPVAGTDGGKAFR